MAPTSGRVWRGQTLKNPQNHPQGKVIFKHLPCLECTKLLTAFQLEEELYVNVISSPPASRKRMGAVNEKARQRSMVLPKKGSPNWEKMGGVDNLLQMNSFLLKRIYNTRNCSCTVDNQVNKISKMEIMLPVNFL